MSRAYMPQAITDDWASPKWVVDQVIAEFGPIDLDPAASEHNAVCDRYYTEEDDGLNQPWDGDLIYTNPPYGRGLLEWVKKALHEYQIGNAKRIVMLMPSRTCTRWFHLLWQKPNVEIRFFKGRLKYGTVPSKAGAPFPSCLVVIG